MSNILFPKVPHQDTEAAREMIHPEAAQEMTHVIFGFTCGRHTARTQAYLYDTRPFCNKITRIPVASEQSLQATTFTVHTSRS